MPRIPFLSSPWVLAIAAACGPAAPAADPQPSAATSAAAVAPVEPVPPAPDVAFLRELVQTLSSDEMDGRRPGTPGGARAVATLIARMQALGLQPAGEQGGWTQRVPMRHVTVDAARTRLTLRTAAAGSDGKLPLRFGEDAVVSTYRAAGTHQIDDELVFVGYGVTAPEYGWDDYDGVDVTGKIVLVLVGDPPLDDGRFAGAALTYYGRWSYKFERALQAGAAGALIVHETEPAAYGWHVVRNSWTQARYHVLEAGGALPDALAVQGWLSRDAAAQLATRVGTTLEAWHAAALAPGFVAAPLGATLDGEFVTVDARTEDVNVLGKLIGARTPAQAVAITAHWDHLGHDPHAAAGVDAIFNGAVDNASGLAGMLAVAAQLRHRVAAGRALGRSVLFIATTGEEEGLLGSSYFVDHPTWPLRELAAVINLDSMNVHGRTHTIQVIGPGHSSLEDTLAEIAAAEGRRVVPDEHPGSGGYYRSDHFSFARRGVPAIYMRGGTDMHDGGTAAGQQLSEVGARHYHTVDDEFDAQWSFEGTLQDVLTVASLAGRVADDEAMPQWRPTSEFAAVPR